MMMLNMFSLIFKVSDDDAAVQSNNTQEKNELCSIHIVIRLC